MATGVKPCSQWSFREVCRKRQEKLYSAIVQKAKAGKQKIVLLLLKASRQSPVIIIQQFIAEISDTSWSNTFQKSMPGL